jgi:hypothetical protein
MRAALQAASAPNRQMFAQYTPERLELRSAGLLRHSMVRDIMKVR